LNIRKRGQYVKRNYIRMINYYFKSGIAIKIIILWIPASCPKKKVLFELF